MIVKTNNFLEQYYEDCKSGKEVIGHELMLQLEILMEDMNSEDYVYDTTDADIRIHFIENVIKLTKSPYYGKPMKLMLFQKAFITALYSFKMLDGTRRFQRAIFLLARKNGKALDLNTRIPTPFGDKCLGEIHTGDLVFGVDGKPKKVLAESPIYTDHKCYKVTFEDGEEIIADAGHKWLIQTKYMRKLAKYNPTSTRRRFSFTQMDNNNCKVLTTEEMINDFVRKRSDGKGVEYKYRVPMAKPIEYPHKEDLFNPYVLGLWLGDGTCCNNVITCSKSDLEQLLKNLKDEKIKAEDNFINGKCSVRLGNFYNVGQVHHNDIRDALRRLNVWGNKHIPEEYFTASIEQRMALLQGLMDTDGFCDKAGQCEFTQKKKEIAFGLSRLLTSLGIKHTVKEKHAECNGKDCGIVYRITFFVDKEHTCFKYERKTARLKDELSPRMSYKSITNIQEIESVPVKCLCVEDELFLCGERNTVTHNSELCSALILTEMLIGGKGMDICAASNNDTQSDILVSAVDTMRLMLDPRSKHTWRNQKGIKCLINDNKLFKLSSRVKNKEGRNIDFSVIDESNEMSMDDAEIVKAIEQSQSLKENPLLILITTEGFLPDGFLSNELKRARGIINGEIKDSASDRYLVWLYTQDGETEIWQGNKENRLWMKSNPTLGTVKKWNYLEQQVDLARTSKTDRAFVFTKDFNVVQSTANAWLRQEDYDYEALFDLEDFRGSICLGAVDIAETTDLTSAKIIITRPNDRKKYIHSMYWIPEGKLEKSDDSSVGAKYTEWASQGLLRIEEGNYLNPSVIADWFLELYKKYGLRIYKIGYDVRFCADFINRLDEYGFEHEMVLQKAEVLSQPISMTEVDLKDKLIVGLNEMDKWCLGNCTLRVNSQGFGILEKIKGISGRRIDGAATLVDAYEMMRRYRQVLEQNN